MIKIIKPRVAEEVEYYCDRHPDRQCYTEISTFSWYGSKFDLSKTEGHLCDECLEKLSKILREEFYIRLNEYSESNN